MKDLSRTVVIWSLRCSVGMDRSQVRSRISRADAFGALVGTGVCTSQALIQAVNPGHQAHWIAMKFNTWTLVDVPF